jgi:hypothetical protein
MAKAKKPVVDDEDSASAKKTAGLKKIHEEALKRYKRVCDNSIEQENRRCYLEDMKFTYVPGEQWLDIDKRARGKDRPMYEFNETRVNGMSVINHIRANRPAAKIRGVEEGDKDLAEIRQGLYLNITNNSDFDSIKDYAAGHQVAGGMGAWRVDTRYSSDTAFDQDIVIEPFIDPMCLRADPSDKTELKTKAKFWFVESKIDNEEYETRWPKADRVSFDVDDELDPDDDDETTWVAEYWTKVPVTKTICLLSDGKSVDKSELTTLPEGVTVALDKSGKPRERTIKTHKIVQYILSGDAILEGPNDWAGSMFPFVPVYGYYIVIEGKAYWGGLTRYQKDPQRALNWALTSVYESIGNSSQSKYWATPEQAKGNVNQWAEANAKNLPAMLYNPDPNAPGPPQRMPGADVPVALINAAGMARDAHKASVGIFNASIGATSNETSGKAIRARQDEGMVATFNFGDNMAKSERRTCEIVNDLQPKIYDTERNIRILGIDGAEKYQKINARDPMTGKVINDMSEGKFDFTVTTGPSFATQRQEAAEFYTGLAQSDPTLMAVAGDLIIKSHDYPMADAIAERKKLMLPPQIAQAINKEKPVPPEVQAAMAQIAQLQQEVAMASQQVAEAGQQAQAEKNAADKAKADVQVAAANIKVQEAQLAQKVAEFKELIATENAKLGATSEQQEAAVDRASLSAELQQALAALQSQAAEFQQQALQTIMQAQQVSQPQVIVMNPPKERTITLQRQNGQTVGRMQEVEVADPQQVVGQVANQAATALQQHAETLAQQLQQAAIPKKTTKSAETVRTADGFETVLTERDESGAVLKVKKARSKRGPKGITTELN